MCRIAVIGAGGAGRNFAAASTRAGFRVTLEDVMPSNLRQASEVFSNLGGSVTLVDTVEDAVRDADIVVDFVPDDLESKLEIWSLIDRMAPPQTVMCTPSQHLSITDLASCTYRDDRCLMVRGEWSKGSVNLISAKSTSEKTRELGETLFRTLGCAVTFQFDPDLPMLLKNMRAAEIS